MLRENLRQERRLETRKAVLCQRPRCPSRSREHRLSGAARGQGAADEGKVWQVQTAGCPLLHAGLGGLLQVVQNGAD